MILFNFYNSVHHSEKQSHNLISCSMWWKITNKQTNKQTNMQQWEQIFGHKGLPPYWLINQCSTLKPTLSYHSNSKTNFQISILTLDSHLWPKMWHLESSIWQELQYICQLVPKNTMFKLIHCSIIISERFHTKFFFSKLFPHFLTWQILYKMTDDGVDPNTCFIICFNSVEVTGSWINKRRRRTATSSTEIAAISTRNPQITCHNQISFIQNVPKMLLLATPCLCA